MVCDELFVDYINMLYKDGKFFRKGNRRNVAGQFFKLRNQKQKFEGFFKYLAELVRKEIEQNIDDVIIIDFAMFSPEMQTKLHRLIDPDLDMLQITVDRAAVYHNGKVIVNAAMQYPAVRSVDFAEKQMGMLSSSADLTAHNTMTHIQHIYGEHLNYVQKDKLLHCYKELDQHCSHPKNVKKTTAEVRLDSVNLKDIGGLRILDIGIGSGYLANHLALMDPPPESIHGIDISKENTKYAQCYSSMITGTTKIVSYHNKLFLDLEEPAASYDVITFMTNAHYFWDQEAFMKKAKYLLRRKGLLVVEFEMSFQNKGTPYSEEPDEEKVLPNIEQLQVLASGWKLVFWGPGVGEGNFDAEETFVVYHFAQKESDRVEIPFPTYSELEEIKGFKLLSTI